MELPPPPDHTLSSSMQLPSALPITNASEITLNSAGWSGIFAWFQAIISTSPVVSSGVITSLDSGTDPPSVPTLLDRKLYTQFKPVDGSTNTTVGEYKFIKGAKKLNHSVQYPQSGNNPSNWMFYFQFHSDSTLIPHPGVYGNIRVYYTDK